MSNEIPLYVRFPELKKIFFGGSIGRSTIDRWEKERGFPKRVKVGPNAVMWETKLVKEWIDSHIVE